MDASDVLMVLGAVLIIAGVAVVYWPAAITLAGIALVAFGVLLDSAPPTEPDKEATK